VFGSVCAYEAQGDVYIAWLNVRLTPTGAFRQVAVIAPAKLVGLALTVPLCPAAKLKEAPASITEVVVAVSTVFPASSRDFSSPPSK
jgi:hypothetical protein